MHSDSPSPQPLPASAANLHEAIRRRAEEIYFRSGCIPGRDVQNWTQAETEIREEATHHRTAVIVKVDGVQYVGEYRPEASDGYVPGEFSPGSQLPVRFHADKMFVKRANGRELETTIVKKIG